MGSQEHASDRFVWDGKNFRPRFDADGQAYQPRAPGIPQPWEVGVCEPTVGGKVKLIGGRYRTLRDVEEPNERGWEPETLRPEPNPDVLEGEERVLAGKLTKMFPETFLEASGHVEAPPPTVPLAKPKLPFSLGSASVGPTQETIAKVREIGHHDFEQKVKLLGLTGKWDTMRLLTATPSRKDNSQKEDEHWAIRATTGTLLPEKTKLPAFATARKKAGPWQTDYMVNFQRSSDESGVIPMTELRNETIAGAGLDATVPLHPVGMGATTGCDPEELPKPSGCEEGCGSNVESGRIKEGTNNAMTSDCQKLRSSRVPQATFHSKMYTIRATG